MFTFDMNVISAPVAFGPVALTKTDFAPVIKDFDPSVEKLSFVVSAGEDNTVFLHNLLDGRGVQVEVAGRVLVTLMGCIARDIPEGCLTFTTKP